MSITEGNCRTKDHSQECLGEIAAQQMKGLIGPDPTWLCACPPAGAKGRKVWYENEMLSSLSSEVSLQPAPAKNDLPGVWGMVMKDMVDRDQLGRQRYGTKLQPHNGRDALRDAYEEALDMVVYLRQAIYERDNPA